MYNSGLLGYGLRTFPSRSKNQYRLILGMLLQNAKQLVIQSLLEDKIILLPFTHKPVDVLIDFARAEFLTKL
jgi:hypothetical protein